MLFPVKETIKNRKSVRSFDGTPLKEADLAALEQFTKNVENPFHIPVTFKFLNVKEYGLSSPVITGAGLYLAAKVPRRKYFEIGFGYSFETVCLYAKSLGIGTVIIAGTFNRDAFEKAMDLKENEVMPAATPVGYPAQRRTIRESLMRKGINADDRIEFDKMFFDGSFDKGMRKENAGVFADALEMARWAPSAANRQPLRCVVIGDTVHFYEEKSMKDSPIGDVQKVDMGIAIAHFDLTMQEDGYSGTFFETDPGITHSEKVQYILSYQKV